MKRHILNQVAPSITTDVRLITIGLSKPLTVQQRDNAEMHPLCRSVSPLVITAIRDKGKHQNAWEFLLSIGVIK